MNMSKQISMETIDVDDGIDMDETQSPERFEEGLDVVVVDDMQQRGTKKRKARNTKKEYWSYFTEYRDENNDLRARCKFCPKHYACDTVKNGTKNVKNHAESCMQNPANQGQGKQPKLAFDDKTNKVKSWNYNYSEVRQAVTEMIIKDEMPFRAVEKEGLKHAFHVACPQFNMPSRTTVARDCLELYKKEKEKLKVFLKSSCQRVCLTTDTWTSIQTESYMCLTGHFIDDDWQLQKRILNFCLIYSHKGEAIGRALEDCLDYWGLCDKVLTVTVDNASTNDVACAYLREMAKSRAVQMDRTGPVPMCTALAKSSGCISQGKYLHVRCMAHILNLIVQDGLKVCVKSLDKVRAVVKYVRSSPSRKHAFLQEVDRCKIACKSMLRLDVPTRWNSTYDMLSVVLKFKAALNRLDIPVMKEEKLGPITFDEWRQIEELSGFLKEFFLMTNRVSGSLYVTSNYMIYHVRTAVMALNKLIVGVDLDLQAVSFEMKKKCDKYWGSLSKMNMLMFVAAILDPSMKFRGVKVALSGIFDGKNLAEMERVVKDFAYELFDEYKAMYAPLDEAEGSVIIPSIVEEDENLAWITQLSEQVTRETSGLQEDSRSEFDLYLSDLKAPYQEKDVLKWWKLNGFRFPILARMARDVLAIPISTVASESAFSTGGRTLDHYRASLLPATVQLLVCAQDWLRTKNRKLKCEDEENNEDVEVLQKDWEENCPDDLNDGVFCVVS